MYFDSSILLTFLDQKYVIQVKWKPRVPGRFKLNTVGLRKKAPGPGGLGGVIRNHRGDWIIGFYQQRSPCQPNPGRLLMEKLGAVMPAHIFREQNKVSDKLSKEGL
ncbi:hypothetical protein KY284_033184 [Solanum tuberosum]|nr:hypothetical protein KY284_033184 [Solanum tuberosum]